MFAVPKRPPDGQILIFRSYFPSLIALATETINSTTVVLNGDILTNADIAQIIEFHRSKGAEATIMLAPVDNPADFGLVEADKNGRVKRFLEKPSPEETTKRKIKTINA